ncbi:hypothetical protein B566_EDAN012199 [Ephemera danica]|nr:hypothetical protein B566_EDAN012199 [Ephemera danica]
MFAAVLLSGMKARDLPYSPYSVKRAVEVTAQHLDSIDEFAQGHGLLQVERAFEHLVTYCEEIERDVRFHVTCGISSKGVHLRGGLQEHSKEVIVNVEPIFLKADETEPSKKINFNVKLALNCSAPWKGPIFEVPITLVKPVAVINKNSPELEFKDIHFKPGTIKRHFIVVPDDATWAVLRLRTTQHDKNSRFVLHCVQLRPQLVCKTLEFHKMVNLAQQLESVQGFPVKGGLVLEAVVAKWWASLGEVAIDYSISFFGLRPELPMVSMHGADGILHLEVRSGLRHEELAPVIQLKTQVQVLRPNDAKVCALGARDVIPPARQIYELQLCYSFHISKATEITPNSALLSDLLYESEFESQLWMLFDANKQLIATGDAYPCKYMVKAEKGDFVLKMHVRHEKRELLDRLTDLTLLLSQKLSSPLTLDVYTSHSQALVAGKKAQPCSLPPGTTQPIYITPLANEKSTKGATIGQYLSGTISYAKDEIGKKVDVYPFRYILPPEPPKKQATTGKSPTSSATGTPPPAPTTTCADTAVNGNKEKEKERSKWDDYQEALRDLRTNWLSKMAGSRAEVMSQSSTLYEELCAAYPEHLPVHVARLQCLDATINERNGVASSSGNSNSSSSSSTLTASSKAQLVTALLTVADTIISTVSQDKLLAFYGMKTDQRPDSAKIKTQMDKQKWALLEALARKGSTLCEIYLSQHDSGTVESSETKSSAGSSDTSSLPTPTLEEIDALMKDILKFADNTDNKQEERSNKEIEEKILRAMRGLKWTHVARHFELSMPVRFPHAYHPF